MAVDRKARKTKRPVSREVAKLRSTAKAVKKFVKRVRKAEADMDRPTIFDGMDIPLRTVSDGSWASVGRLE